MEFFKMHGAGNDYVYVDCMEKQIPNPEALAVKLSDRHFSIGGDGLILLCKSDIADCRMRMFNADGSEGRMCGNGVRCVGKLAHDLGYVKGNRCTVETLSGIKTLDYVFDGANVVGARVDMGKAVLDCKKIPAKTDCKDFVNKPLTVNSQTFNVTLVSMGNPHCVTFFDPSVLDVGKMQIEKIGPSFENHPMFPERINTEFVNVIARNELKMRVWERGSGETLACGTGACATAVSAVLNGYCDYQTEITVHLLGGDLKIVYTKDSDVYMTGGATLVFKGEIDL